MGGLQPFTVYKINVTVSHPNGTELHSREVYGASGETCKLNVVRYSKLLFSLSFPQLRLQQETSAWCPGTIRHWQRCCGTNLLDQTVA